MRNVRAVGLLVFAFGFSGSYLPFGMSTVWWANPDPEAGMYAAMFAWVILLFAAPPIAWWCLRYPRSEWNLRRLPYAATFVALLAPLEAPLLSTQGTPYSPLTQVAAVVVAFLLGLVLYGDFGNVLSEWRRNAD